jgi:hypothetical protein
VDVGSVADVSEAHPACIYRVEVCKVVEVLCIYRFVFKKQGDTQKLTHLTSFQPEDGSSMYF